MARQMRYALHNFPEIAIPCKMIIPAKRALVQKEARGRV